MPHAKAIWLLSDGRSGSTWFAQLLNHARTLHVEHEPVHALFNPRLAGEPLVPMPAGADLEYRYRPLLADVLAGRHRTQRFGRETAPGQEPQGLVIRDIHAMGIAPLLLPAFPELRPVVLVRHPLDVAQSKLALGDWQWFSAIEDFVLDPAMSAHLGRLRRWVDAADSLFKRYVVHWAVTYHWFFGQMGRTLPVIVPYPLTMTVAASTVADLLGEDATQLLASDSFMAAFQRRSATDNPVSGRRLLDRVLNKRSGPTAAEREFTERVINAFGLRWLLEPADARELRVA